MPETEAYPGKLFDPHVTDGDKCPCCGHHRLELGLFDKNHVQALPVPLSVLPDISGFSYIEQDLLCYSGRYFLRVEVPLPVVRTDSPVRPRLWVEISRGSAVECLTKRSTNAFALLTGHLANDVPGFGGTLGAEVSVSAPPRGSAIVKDCADNRIARLSAFDHESMVRLYRRIWGNSSAVAPAIPKLRAGIIANWINTTTASFRKQVYPIPAIAGIRPAEIMVAPPEDTGCPAEITTIGCSEPWFAHENAVSPVEIVNQCCDPSPEFIEGFAELAYISRTGALDITPDTVVIAEDGIRGADPDMRGWILREPWFLEPNQRQVEVEGRVVEMLEAVPVYAEEIQYGCAHGSEALSELLRDVDTTDLHRNSTTSD